MGTDTNLNYYEVLQCDQSATTEELKKSYQRLILTTHPDKGQNKCDSFQLIQKAWSVLRDAETRRQYDAQLSCQEHSNLLLYDTISLSEMEFRAEDELYTYNCRCGGTYTLEASVDYETQKVVIGCDECSFSIQVNIR